MIRLFRVFVPGSAFGLLIFEALLILSAFVFSGYLLLEVELHLIIELVLDASAPQQGPDF